MEKDNTTKRDWYLFDAEDKVLGRISTEIANLLRGKGKTVFENNTDCGDYVVLLNAGKVVLTGNKENEKRYYKHTKYIGNLKTFEFKKLKEDKPEEIIRHAVIGMLPKNKLQKEFISRLKIYRDATHPHQNVKFKNEVK
jgi:large subunit ribosomal protein L13